MNTLAPERDMNTKTAYLDLPASDYCCYRFVGESELPSTHNSYKIVLSPSRGEARVQECLCFGGRVLSYSLRRLDNRRGHIKVNMDARLVTSGYVKNANKRRPRFFNTIAELARAIFIELFRPTVSPDKTFRLTSPKQGLVVIAGSTGAAKSGIGRVIIHEYLAALLKGARLDRKPHLVTVEDPIEVYFHDLERRDVSTKSWIQEGLIDYTPRDLHKDTTSLQEAVNDALRQKPSLFYFGETRNRDDWKTLVNFAGTGHLILTTSHAGSLQEAISQIMQANESSTSQHRSVVASRLIGVVHLRPLSLRSGIELTPQALFFCSDAAGDCALAGVAPT